MGTSGKEVFLFLEDLFLAISLLADYHAHHLSGLGDLAVGPRHAAVKCLNLISTAVRLWGRLAQRYATALALACRP
jgi:hypothetical protein